MLPPVRFGLLLQDVIGPLPERDLMRAHGLAKESLAGTHVTGLRFWLVQSLNALAGTAVALAGYLLLDWSAYWIVAAMAVDLFATLIADELKQRLAPGPSQAEMVSALEAESLMTTIKAMAKSQPWPGLPGPPRRATPELMRSLQPRTGSPRRFLYRGCDRRQDPALAARRLLLQVRYLVVLPFCGLMLLVLWGHEIRPDPETLALLGLLAVCRPAEAVLESRAALRDGGQPHPRLLPQSPGAAATLFLSAMAFGCIANVIHRLCGNIGDEQLFHILNGIFLALHFLTTAAILYFWHFRLGRHAAAVRSFASLDLEALRARWASVNGEDASLRLATAQMTSAAHSSASVTPDNTAW